MQRTVWSAKDFCREADFRILEDVFAADVYDIVCRVDFAAPGFCLIDLGESSTSVALRRFMVSLQQRMDEIHRARTGRGLVYLSAARFDQQATTKFHRDGGPAECFLMLGYEPTSIEAKLSIADYSHCAHDLGMSPSEFLDRHNPMFGAGAALLEPYVTDVACFSQRRFQVVLINNSNADHSSDSLSWQGVLHTANIVNPNDAVRRIVNSTMIAPAPIELSATLSPDDFRDFLTTQTVHRRGYGRTHLTDDK